MGAGIQSDRYRRATSPTRVGRGAPRSGPAVEDLNMPSPGQSASGGASRDVATLSALAQRLHRCGLGHRYLGIRWKTNIQMITFEFPSGARLVRGLGMFGPEEAI